MAHDFQQYAIGIDLGGTKIEMGVVDSDGKIFHRLRLMVEKGAEAVQKQLLKGIDELKQNVNGSIRGIGIGVAGQIDPVSGLVIFAPNLRWHNVPLQANLESILKIPVRIANDVRVITYGEWLYGAGRGIQDLLCIFVGTGIGSGVVIEGKLMTGFSNTFGEIGHLTVDFNGPLCTCGSFGCMETFAAGWGIAERAKDLTGNEDDSMTSKTVFEAYHRGDPWAQEVIAQAKKALSAGCASLINILSPQRLILGGGVIDGMPELVDDLNRGVRQLALRAATERLEVVQAALGKEAGVIGAGAMIFNTII